MIKFISIAAIALMQAATVSAQPPTRIKPTVKTTPVTQTPAPAGNTAPNSWDFFLTSAKATIYTGSDNKEQPSQVQMQMSIGNVAACNYMVPTSSYQEFAVNSVVDLPLAILYNPSFTYDKPQLGHVENGGIRFWIYYTPNFPLDAWKIEKVVFTLEFRDLKGNLHPTVGIKTITFVNLGATLNKEHGSLRCEADRFMMPTTTAVLK